MFEQKWKPLLKNHIGHLLKYMVVQQLGGGRITAVIFYFYLKKDA